MKTSKEEQMLATGNVGNLFIKFGIPGVLGLLLIGFQPMVDGIFLINYVGPDALAGVNLFVPVYTFVSALAVVVGIGSQTIVSLSLGAKNYATANDSFRTAGVFLGVFLLVLSALCHAGAEPLSRFLGADADLQYYTVSYIRYLSPFLPVLALLFLGDYMLTDAGDREVITAIAVTGATNVAFAFFFNGQNILSSSLFTSMGDARSSVVISLMRGLLLVVIGIFILPLIFGNAGVWLVIPLSELITLLYCFVIVRKKASWLLTK